MAEYAGGVITGMVMGLLVGVIFSVGHYTDKCSNYRAETKLTHQAVEISNNSDTVFIYNIKID